MSLQVTAHALAERADTNSSALREVAGFGERLDCLDARAPGGTSERDETLGIRQVTSILAINAAQDAEHLLIALPLEQ